MIMMIHLITLALDQNSLSTIEFLVGYFLRHALPLYPNIPFFFQYMVADRLPQ